jgi:uncharacterized metal-binding protein YceD (DUF177 family)
VKIADFDINFLNISDEGLSISLELGNEFFDLKENSLYDKCRFKVQVLCTKYDSSVNVNVEFDGVIITDCERCLEEIEVPCQNTFLEAIKLTGDSDLFEHENYISRDHQIFNLYDCLYENICLSVPTRKVCENSLKNQECILHNNEAEKTESDEENSVWSELKKLKL